MATSGNSNVTITANDICSDALMEVGALAAGETATSEDITDARKQLMYLTKQWMGKSNLALPGLKLWKRRHILMDLTATPDYTLIFKKLSFTSGGTHELLRGDTITGATSSATAWVASVEVTSGTWAAGTAAGELIIMSQSGTFQSENLNEGANSNVATIASDSAQFGPPTDIIHCMRRDSDGDDHPMDYMDLGTYLLIGDKDAEGTPLRFYYESRPDTINLHLDCKPDDTTDNLFFVALFPIEDFDATTDNPDFPREWYRALKWNLAKELLAKYPCPRDTSKFITGMAIESLAISNTFAPENASEDAYFQPDL